MWTAWTPGRTEDAARECGRCFIGFHLSSGSQRLPQQVPTVEKSELGGMGVYFVSKRSTYLQREWRPERKWDISNWYRTCGGKAQRPWLRCGAPTSKHVGKNRGDEAGTGGAGPGPPQALGSSTVTAIPGAHGGLPDLDSWVQEHRGFWGGAASWTQQQEWLLQTRGWEGALGRGK